jgi:hypothetical protein
MIVIIAQNIYGLWPMGYGCKIPASGFEKSKMLCTIREYGVYLVSVKRESTVCSLAHPSSASATKCVTGCGRAWSLSSSSRLFQNQRGFLKYESDSRDRKLAQTWAMSEVRKPQMPCSAVSLKFK